MNDITFISSHFTSQPGKKYKHFIKTPLKHDVKEQLNRICPGEYEFVNRMSTITNIYEPYGIEFKRKDVALWFLLVYNGIYEERPIN